MPGMFSSLGSLGHSGSRIVHCASPHPLGSCSMVFVVGSVMLYVCVCKFYEAADKMVAVVYVCSYIPMFSEHSAC